MTLVYRIDVDGEIVYAESLAELLTLFRCDAPFARTVRVRALLVTTL